MANIVVTHFSGIMSQGKYCSLAFYDGLIQSLCAEGHNVLQVITSAFLIVPWNGSNKPRNQRVKAEVLNKIKTFKPDLIISFNNSSIEGIEDAVDCPIALWDADKFIFFNDKEFILENQDRFHYLAFNEDGLQTYKKTLSVNSDRICRVRSATAVRNVEEKKVYDISFIGNTFFNSPAITEFFVKYPSYRDIDFRRNDPDIDLITDIAERQFGVTKNNLMFRQAGYDRASLISLLLLLDYDIKLFGAKDWLRLGLLSEKIIDAYDPSLVYSLEHNQKIYNRSNIAISVSHSQNVSGYPWRIMDIMASSSVLLSDFKSDIQNDFGNKVDLQLYHSYKEAIDLADKLCKSTSLRQDIVNQQNEAIDEGFRWIHRFPLIAQVTGVDLTPCDQEGIHEVFRDGVGLSNGSMRICEKLLFLDQLMVRLQGMGLARRVVGKILYVMFPSVYASFIDAAVRKQSGEVEYS